MKIISVQYLRAIAALLVVYVDAGGMAQLPYTFQTGAYGVDIFFVISGFIMWTTTSRDTPAIQFAQHRLIRILPIYWLLTIVFFSFKHTADWSELAKSLAFISYTSPKTGRINPIIEAGWTLNFEMFFYSVFVVGLAFKRRAVVVFGFLITLVGLSTVVKHQDTPLWTTYTSPMLLQFLGGCCIAELHKRQLLAWQSKWTPG